MINLNYIRNCFYLSPIRYFKLILIALIGSFIGAGFLQSCSDDIGKNTNENDNGENFTGITLYLPDVESAAEFGYTRNDEFANTRAFDISKEASFNTLYIAAVSQEDNSVTTFMKTTSNGSEEGYNKYRINLKEGNYKIYVVSNLNRYLEGSDTTFPDIAKEGEDAIRSIVLNFDADRPLEPGFLPMACLAEDIKVGENASSAKKSSESSSYFDEDYVIIPAGENIKVYADLKYLCSKVRYTILFDRENSEFKGTNDILNFHRNNQANFPFVTKIRKQMALNNVDGGTASDGFISELSSGNDAINSKWELNLDRYIFPEKEVLNVINSSSSSKEEVKKKLDGLSLWSETSNDWNTTWKDKRVWQGVTYLPENLLGEGNFTTLNFPYTINGEDGVNSPRCLELFSATQFGSQDNLTRGMMYDVIVNVKSADPQAWTIDVVPTDWTVQELAFQLHGPYELIVETTSVSVSMEEDALFWFRSDVPPSQIGFISPQVSISQDPNNKDSMRDLFVGGVVKNSDGTYATNENGDYLFQVGLNVEIPYSIINKLNTDGLKYGETIYTKKDISYFHIVAGSLQKRIEVTDLNLDPYLMVSPQSIIIDTRELYTSGENNSHIDILFETNVDVKDVKYVDFTISDPDKIIGAGKGNGALRINPDSDHHKTFMSKTTSGYKLNEKTEQLRLTISDIISGNTFWNENSEFTLKFTLKIYPDVDENGNPVGTPETLEKTVTIKVHPFSGNYVIHFRDNTKNWEDPHIYVYQLLTLPSDLPAVPFDDPGYNAATTPKHEFAGKIVGYIERNPSSGLQWNAAVQYVFSNNLSFKGWKGYGGPDINDPWAEATVTYNNPSDLNNSNNSTMGFVMFGKTPDNNPVQGCWNYSYAYNYTEGLPENPDRKQRYNYDINFNSDHDNKIERWVCTDCINMSPDYNRYDNQRFYTGIAMEKEEDGWWRYTLSGVAQPGRTMIIFANYHAPWTYPGGDYAAEDNRWPGDYETGLPLFDFEDNEGWFLFDGNTTNSDQRFSDDRPTTKEIPYQFNSSYTKNMTIEVKKPVYGTSLNTNITIGGNSNYTLTENSSTGRYYVDFSDPTLSENNSVIEVILNGKTYKLRPKNFVHSGNRYVTAQPLYVEYDPEMSIFVKWNDNVSGQGYNPPSMGNNKIGVYWSSGDLMKNIEKSEKDYGNYKYNTFNPSAPPTGGKDEIQFRLPQNDGSNFTKNVKVQDLPQYYNPTHSYYQINVHKLP